MSAITSVLNTSQAAGAATTGSISSNSDALTSEQTFLQILIAQIQNQDPTSPTDPTQFVSQLTQYSELEQLIGINQGVQKINSTAATNTTTTSATNPAN
jgi:flagellar basal-body rod modification protein FlgD